MKANRRNRGVAPHIRSLGTGRMMMMMIIIIIIIIIVNITVAFFLLKERTVI